MATESPENRLETRMAHIEGAFSQIDKRLSSLEAGQSDVHVEIRTLRGELGSLRTEMRQQFYWILGVVILGILAPIAIKL